MAKTNSQKFQDDLNSLLDKYPHMKVSQVIETTQNWLESIFHQLPLAGKTKVTIEQGVKRRYRIA